MSYLHPPQRGPAVGIGFADVFVGDAGSVSSILFRLVGPQFFFDLRKRRGEVEAVVDLVGGIAKIGQVADSAAAGHIKRKIG